jgi:IS30 family transposase
VFFAGVRSGLGIGNSAVAAGLGGKLATAWMRESGGVIRVAKPTTGHRLSLAEREEIEELRAQRVGIREIGRRLGRDHSTISKEVRRNRNVSTTSTVGKRYYRYSARSAQLQTEVRARRPQPTKLQSQPELVMAIEALMSGISRLSPEQVSHALVRAYPDDEAMRISAETIYVELYVQGRGSLRADLHKHLRTGRARRTPRPLARRPRVPGELLIANRPKDVDGRTIPGHWEGDLVVGKHNGSAIGTLVERLSRFVILLHLPESHDAPTVADQIASQMAHLPEHITRSLTWDQGSEMIGAHQQVSLDTGMTVWFCDPGKPWQRGSNENTNGLLRQYFPKGSDLTQYTEADLKAVADGLNARPRKTLNWATPAETMATVISNHKPLVT